jgi:hypothetical protein
MFLYRSNFARRKAKPIDKVTNWQELIKQDQRNKRNRIRDLPRHLQGPSQNRFGGHQSQRMRALRGSKLGPASDGRFFDDHERKLIEDRLRRDGLLT